MWIVLCELGETEISNFRSPVMQENIRYFQISVDNILPSQIQ